MCENTGNPWLFKVYVELVREGEDLSFGMPCRIHPNKNNNKIDFLIPTTMADLRFPIRCSCGGRAI